MWNYEDVFKNKKSHSEKEDIEARIKLICSSTLLAVDVLRILDMCVGFPLPKNSHVDLDSIFRLTSLFTQTYLFAKGYEYIVSASHDKTLGTLITQFVAGSIFIAMANE